MTIITANLPSSTAVPSTTITSLYGGMSDTLTLSDTSSIVWDTSPSQYDLSFHSTIALSGANPDITINGDSVVSRITRLENVIEKVESRLNILAPRKDLESKWEELRLLGEKYRELEKDIESQLQVFDILNK